jgi:hypothetical protein
LFVVPIDFEFSHLKIEMGGMIAADLNGGYRASTYDTVPGSVLIKVMGNRF